MGLILPGNYSRVNPSVRKPFLVLEGGLSLPPGLFLSEDRNPLSLEEHHLRAVEKARQQFRRALEVGSYRSLQFLYLTWMKSHPDLVDAPAETARELIGGFGLDDTLDPVTTRSVYDGEPYLTVEELIDRNWDSLRPAYFYPDEFRSPNGRLDLFHMAWMMAEDRPVYSRDCPMGDDLYHCVLGIALWHELLNPGAPFGLDQGLLAKIMDCSKMAVCKAIKRAIASGVLIKAPGSTSSAMEAKRARKVYTYLWVTTEVYSNRDVKILGVGRPGEGPVTPPTGSRREEKRVYRNRPASGLSDEQFLKRFKRLKRRRGGQYRAECPGHDDSTPSLDILILPDRRLVHCFACCEAEEIMEAIGLGMSDLFKNNEPKLGNVLKFRRR